MVAHLDAGRGHSGNFGFGAFYIAKTVQNDVGALLGQGFGNAEANAAGGAGNESSFSFEHGGFQMVDCD